MGVSEPPWGREGLACLGVSEPPWGREGVACLGVSEPPWGREGVVRLGVSEPPWGREGLAQPAHLMKPLREMISAWQSLTVSPFRLRESPFTQRLPGGTGRKEGRVNAQRTATVNGGGLLGLRA